MESRKRFLPESFSVALKHGLTRIAGVVLVLVGLWAVFALFFHNPYLNGWAAASTFGKQSIMGNIVGFLRYGVGFFPTLFIF